MKYALLSTPILHSTTARPHKPWLPESSGAKAIDFCVYAGYDDSQDKITAVERLCAHTATLTANHTDFLPLQRRPIILSIETKIFGGELNAAQLQMGVWHGAQWNFLRSAVIATIKSRKQPLPPWDDAEVEREADGVMARLPFIPRIIVWGHSWSLVLSTREKARRCVGGGNVLLAAPRASRRYTKSLRDYENC